MDTDLDHVGGCVANYSKFIKLLLSFVIAISPILLINNANAAVGGWDLKNPVAQGASTVYDATKNVLINGKKFIKESSVKITPTASGVANVLARGGAGYALSVAVEQLLGAVDWVLDPENNRIKYYDPADPNSIPNAPTNKIWTHQCGDPAKKLESYSLNAMASFLLQCQWDNTSISQEITSTNKSTGSICVRNVRTHGTYNACTTIKTRTITVNDPPREQDRPEKSIPLETVAQKVISNAEGGDTAAQGATTAAAADIVSEAEKDNAKARPIASQAEANATTKPADAAEAEKANEAQGEAKPNEANPEATDLSLTFPIFCNWAPTICEAAQTVISFPQTLTNWWDTGKSKAEEWALSISESWAAAKEWATSEPSQENTQVDVENNNTQEIDTQVSFSSQCPAPINLANFSYHGISQSWTVDFSKFCDVFATYLKPVVISIGAFSAVLIVSGVGVRENG